MSSLVDVFSGHCLCGGVEYKFEGVTFENIPSIQILICHCSMCRHGIGASCVPFIGLPFKKLKFAKAECLSNYQSSTFAKRTFCKRCGCSTFIKYINEYDEPHTIWVSIATLNEEIQSSDKLINLLKHSKKNQHIHYDSKQRWENIVYAIGNDNNCIKVMNQFEGWIRDPCAPQLQSINTTNVKSKL